MSCGSGLLNDITTLIPRDNMVCILQYALTFSTYSYEKYITVLLQLNLQLVNPHNRDMIRLTIRCLFPKGENRLAKSLCL
jgi:hypothetical protein